ncbi:MAG: PIN domain-containing protein [Bacteroidetes bacterium]|nr:PIN domain-containing protein [Bacteroidota bacterium]
MTDKIEFLVETDILVDHLIHDDFSKLSDLELAMTKGICFTTVINSSEMYFHSSTEKEKHAVDGVMRAVKVLGIHPRYSLNISEFFNKVASTRDAMICSLAKINKLPILTAQISKYKDSGIKIISPKEL